MRLNFNLLACSCIGFNSKSPITATCSRDERSQFSSCSGYIDYKSDIRCFYSAVNIDNHAVYMRYFHCEVGLAMCHSTGLIGDTPIGPFYYFIKIDLKLILYLKLLIKSHYLTQRIAILWRVLVFLKNNKQEKLKE